MSRRVRARLVPACLLVLLLLPAASADELVEATLDNGLRVLLLEDHRNPIVSLQLWYRVGSRDERAGLSGVSHMLEHMMFKGTGRYGPGAYARLVEERGGEHNAYTSRDATVYHVDIAAQHVDLILELEADRMQRLALAPREFAAERSVVLEERRTRSEDDPVGALLELFAAAAFVAHPYRLPTIGFQSDIERLEHGDVRAWYNTYYLPNNALLVAVGDFGATAMLEKIRAHFASIPRGLDPPRVRAVEPRQQGERRVVVRRPAGLPAILIGYHAPNHTSSDGFALEVLSTVLAAGKASRLRERLVRVDRLALEVGGEYTRLTIDPDTFTLYATALPGTDIGSVEQVLVEEIERVKTELVSAEELERAKNQIEADFVFRQDSVHARAAALGQHELVGGWRGLLAYLPGVRGVTGEDVRRVARQYLDAERRTTAVLLPGPPADRAPTR